MSSRNRTPVGVEADFDKLRDVKISKALGEFADKFTKGNLDPHLGPSPTFTSTHNEPKLVDALVRKQDSKTRSEIAIANYREALGMARETLGLEEGAVPEEMTSRLLATAKEIAEDLNLFSLKLAAEILDERNATESPSGETAEL